MPDNSYTVSREELERLRQQIGGLKHKPLDYKNAPMLVESMDRLTEALTRLVVIFDAANRDMAQEAANGIHEEHEKMDRILAQNEKIARAIVQLADVVKHQHTTQNNSQNEPRNPGNYTPYNPNHNNSSAPNTQTSLSEQNTPSSTLNPYPAMPKQESPTQPPQLQNYPVPAQTPTSPQVSRPLAAAPSFNPPKNLPSIEPLQPIKPLSFNAKKDNDFDDGTALSPPSAPSSLSGSLHSSTAANQIPPAAPITPLASPSELPPLSSFSSLQPINVDSFNQGLPNNHYPAAHQSLMQSPPTPSHQNFSNQMPPSAPPPPSSIPSQLPPFPSLNTMPGAIPSPSGASFSSSKFNLPPATPRSAALREQDSFMNQPVSDIRPLTSPDMPLDMPPPPPPVQGQKRGILNRFSFQ